MREEVVELVFKINYKILEKRCFNFKIIGKVNEVEKGDR